MTKKLKLTDASVSAIELPPGRPQILAWDSELTGFGVVVGKRARTFIVNAWVGGQKRRTSIGVLGAIREDRRHWTATLARLRAKELLGDMAAGIDPNAEPEPEAERHKAPSGPTLNDALDAHLARMRKKRRASRSISTLKKEVTKYLAGWLARPISDLTGAAMVELHERIKTEARARRGSNPQNDKGAPLANRVVTHVGACWNSLNRKLEGRLGNWNPAKAVDRDVLKPKRERVSDEDLPAWRARVQTLSPVRRDMHLFCMFSAMRSEAARNMRWEHVDLDARSLTVPNPKGGEGKAFRLPLGPTLVEILRRRLNDNAAEFEPYGGDGGLVFPSLSRAKPYKVQPIREAKERRKDPTTGVREKYLSGPHVSRRTYLSVASDAKISELDRSVLANHAFGSQSVNQTYIEQAFPHLLECQTKIDVALSARMGIQIGAPAGSPIAQPATHRSISAFE